MIAIRIECGSSCQQLIPPRYQAQQRYAQIVECARTICPSWTSMEVAVIFVDAKRMREINRAYHGLNRVTDVLSFRYSVDMPGQSEEGELYLNPDQIVRQARRYGSTRDAEFLRVTIHGLLHLQGYDHMTSPDRRRMNQLALRIRSCLQKDLL